MWIARSKDGSLRLYLSKRPPLRFEGKFLDDGDESSGYGSLSLLSSQYPDINYDNSPFQVEFHILY